MGADSDTGGRTGGAWGLLRSNPPFLALFGARTVSCAGDALSLTALVLHVATTTSQGTAVALVLLAGDFLPALLSPVTGAVSDRFDRRRVMITSELVQGAAVLLLAAALPTLPGLVTLVAARAVAGQVFLSASRSAMPALVAGRDLAVGNATTGFGGTCAEALGPLLAGVLLPLIGVRGVLLVDTASFLISAALLATLCALPPPHSHDGAPAALLTQARAGLSHLLLTPALRVTALGFCAIVALNGVDDVALVLLARKNLAADDTAVGVLLSAVGIGLLAGHALVARCAGRASMAVLLVAGFAVSSAGNALTGLAWAVAAAFTTQAVRGLGIAAMDVASTTLVQRLVPADMLGRVFGNLHGALGVAAALSYLAGGLLLDATSAPVTFLLAGGGGVLVTLVVAVVLPRGLRRHAGFPPPTAGGPAAPGP